jgi:NADH-quinone oxidoreductase subunit K
MFINQICANIFLYLTSLCGLVFNRKNLLLTLMSFEVLLLSVNLNFAIFSVYLDDMYGQLFSLFILAVAASESAIGLALLITHYRLYSTILVCKKSVLRF